VRADLSNGMKAAQACHALRAFVAEYPEIEGPWFRISNNIVILEHDDLDGLANRLASHGLALSRFHEPDRDGQLTAICVEPAARNRVSTVRLAR
jgi:hypothetical protein